MLAGKLDANIQWVELVHVHRDDVHLRLNDARRCGEPIDEPGYQQVGVRAGEERGDDRGDFLACHGTGGLLVGCGV